MAACCGTRVRPTPESCCPSCPLLWAAWILCCTCCGLGVAMLVVTSMPPSLLGVALLCCCRRRRPPLLEGAGAGALMLLLGTTVVLTQLTGTPAACACVHCTAAREHCRTKFLHKKKKNAVFAKS